MPKILIIEDDPFLSDIYATKFNQDGFDVELANNGEIGFKKIQEGKPDIILLDIILPKINGLEVLKNIKESPKFKDIPVILLSNLGQEDEIKKGLKLGAAQYLIKANYEPSEVVKIIRQTLEGKI